MQTLDAPRQLDPIEVSGDVSAVFGIAPRRLHYFFERQCDCTPAATALISGSERLSYSKLDECANQLANYLLTRGAGFGKPVGILLERSTYTYIALLAVLKAGSPFVPIDPSYPADRIAFIAQDAGLSLILSTSGLRASYGECSCAVVSLDDAARSIESMPKSRLAFADQDDELAYIIYTSGTTGRPKGVAVNHSRITHFLSVCTPIYGIESDDRVYQGMTIAFDFSIEEIWPTWIAGATLVAGPTDMRRMGSGLADFLHEHQITALYCVPTLLATLDRDIPSLNTLIVGGEACPRDLVDRWSRPGRRMLNTYGPTETTVTATWCELLPGAAVTIGRPMPGYRTYVLDENLKAVPPGESGEIVIGGAGVAEGYVNRPELTAAKFVLDPFEKKPGARMYRSGDLGRFTNAGEIEFLGRIDSQVKIRGFRIELGEIEAVILEDADIENAIVAAVPFHGAAQDLAAYVTVRDASVDFDAVRDRLAVELRRRVPVYMVPAYIELLDTIPMLASGKADRKQLPEPRLPRLSARTGAYVAPETDLERSVSEVWNATFGRDEVSVQADFFLDLGGHSLFAAQVISKLRNIPEFRHLSIGDLYAHPTIRSLAAHVETHTAAATPIAQRAEPRLHSSARVWSAGAFQFGLLYVLLAILGAPVALVLAEHGLQRSLLTFSMYDLTLPFGIMLLSLVLPIVLKWTLIGRFAEGKYPLWGFYFCRWWVVRKALEFSPAHYLAGSPLYPVYARLLGARIGKNTFIGSSHMHLPDLIEIGDGASIGYEAEIEPYAVEDGWLHVAPIKIGKNAFVGTKSVLMLGAEIGDGARVAEQTLVTRDQKIPARESWAGSPAEPTGKTDPLLDRMESRPSRPTHLRPWLWVAYIAAFIILEALPLIIAVPGLFAIAMADYFGGRVWAVAATPLAGLLYVLTACVVVWAGKRLVLPTVQPGLYGMDTAFALRKWFADKLMLMSLTFTNTLYATLYAVPWLRALGARVGPRSEVSTVSHIDPDLLSLGTETFVADLASLGAATFHNGHLALTRTQIGDRTFIGNASVVRSNTHLPDNCLIGVQSVAPTDQPQAGTSWLGSPALFLPRRQQCEGFGENVTYRPSRTLVAYRLFVEFLRIVLPPAMLYLMGSIVTFASVALLKQTSAVVLVFVMPLLFVAAGIALTLVVAAMKWAIVGTYRPRVEPLWAPFVRHTEFITGLYESAVVPTIAGLLTGTPLIAPVLRLFGVNIGRRVYIETSFMTEFDLVRIGDDTAIGRATSLQTHLFEDRVMKMSTVTIGNRCSIGGRAVVLYDSTVGDDAQLDALSLVMKGESIPENTSWSGIPARLV